MGGITDLIAHNETHYVDLAVTMANDRDWQREMRDLIVSRLPRLFHHIEASELWGDMLLDIASRGPVVTEWSDVNMQEQTGDQRQQRRQRPPVGGDIPF